MFHIAEEEEEIEVLEAKEAKTVSWRKKIPGGYRLTFVMDSGAGRTILPKNAIPGMKMYKNKRTGQHFRMADGGRKPNLGEVEFRGVAQNMSPVVIKNQVADITRPLAATLEMADADNLVVTWCDGGVIKKITPESLERIKEAIRREQGAEIPVDRSGSTYTIDIDISEEAIEGFRSPKKTVRPQAMEVDYVTPTSNRFEAFWQRSEEKTFHRQA